MIRWMKGLLSLFGGAHKHKCPNLDCGHVWAHTAKEANEQYGQGGRPHNCSECGALQLWHYKGR